MLDWSGAPFAKWFVGGKLNVSANCLDRHVAHGRGDRVAFHFEGEPGDTRTITYAELLTEVQRVANALKGMGVHKGDRVALYMPMIPELPVAMLACARIGAAHSVVFGGFSAASLSDRINDAEAKVLITADGGYRRGAPSMLKASPTKRSRRTPTIENVLVVRRIGDAADPVNMVDGRDHWWHELVPSASAECPPEAMDSEDLLYLLYTSGTTGKPKGIMHTTGGYLTQAAYTHNYVFDLHPETDVYWCAADIGWVTGHSYIVYGPLANCATSVMYEGTPDTPSEPNRDGDRLSWAKDRFWEIVEDYGVTKLYTAPTAIRTFMKWGTEWPEGRDLSSLKVLGSVGEPINPEAWVWYHTYIGGGRCPIVDTWWQTETGAMMIAPLPGVTTLKPGSASRTLPGISAELVDDAGEPVGVPGGGYLTLTEPWPSMLRGIWGDPDRYRETYWSRFEGRYFAGDGAKLDDDGDIWLLGRVDDVMNISGHRLSTTEIESALVDHPAVAEAAVVGRDDADDGPGDQRVRDRPRWGRVDRRTPRRTSKSRRQGDQPDRQTRGSRHRARTPQDPIGQDHAAVVARSRRRPDDRRHDDTRRSEHRSRDRIRTQSVGDQQTANGLRTLTHVVKGAISVAVAACFDRRGLPGMGRGHGRGSPVPRSPRAGRCSGLLAMASQHSEGVGGMDQRTGAAGGGPRHRDRGSAPPGSRAAHDRGDRRFPFSGRGRGRSGRRELPGP